MKTRRLILALAVVSTAVTLFVLAFFLSLPMSAAAHPSGDAATGRHISEGPELEKPTRIIIRLTGATTYEIAELFNQALHQTPGVSEIKRLRSRIEPGEPRACLVEWQVQATADIFQLESDLYHLLRDYAQGSQDISAESLSFVVSEGDRELLGRVRPYSATSREIVFIAMNGIADPAGPTATEPWPTNHGFE